MLYVRRVEREWEYRGFCVAFTFTYGWRRYGNDSLDLVVIPYTDYNQIVGSVHLQLCVGVGDFRSAINPNLVRDRVGKPIICFAGNICMQKKSTPSIAYLNCLIVSCSGASNPRHHQQLSIVLFLPIQVTCHEHTVVQRKWAEACKYQILKAPLCLCLSFGSRISLRQCILNSNWISWV